ncbi:hypothetical protein HGRIS_000826 [Hohenbuehelia grisea]|uniref:Uncharacterized protein n=1 Tax=Hohenbuehelia grisea TaxID=104357 RepID=A0ABR3IPV8_9AGAR
MVLLSFAFKGHPHILQGVSLPSKTTKASVIPIHSLSPARQSSSRASIADPSVHFRNVSRFHSIRVSWGRLQDDHLVSERVCQCRKCQYQSNVLSAFHANTFLVFSLCTCRTGISQRVNSDRAFRGHYEDWPVGTHEFLDINS